jgi:hypothetical protein
MSRLHGPLAPLGLLLNLFSSIWLGVALLFLLFIYASIGSAGMPVKVNILRPDAWMPLREAVEMSEFQWFQWWPFKLLIALICINLSVATIRRIPLRVVNLGVWMIHTGIIVLAIGSVWYFGTKLEGDAPVARRQVVASLPGLEPVAFTATPGNTVRLGSENDPYLLRVTGITPEWELLSGEDAGMRAYKVSVQVQHRDRMFIRELLAGYPEYTEDVVRSDDPQQPFQRAKKVNPDGDPLVDRELELALEYAPQEHFYLRESRALYLREVGTTEWIERPIRRMPLFNDYIASPESVWYVPGAERPPLNPLEIAIPPADGTSDPLPDVTFQITEYLRYASMQTRRMPGGDRLDPAATVRLDFASGDRQSYELRAFDPAASRVAGGALEFIWIDSVEQLKSLLEVRQPMLRIRVPSADVEIDAPITEVAANAPDLPFTEIDGTDYVYRVQTVYEGLPLQNRTVNLAIVDIRRGDETITRWVSDDPAVQRDLIEGDAMSAHGRGNLIDENIEMVFRPGQRAGLRLVAGPKEDRLRLLSPDPTSGAMIERAVRPGEPLPIAQGMDSTVTSYAPRSRSVTRPMIVPRRQRDPNVHLLASMVRIEIPDGIGSQLHWLPFHQYPFERREERLRRFSYQPTVVRLADGRDVELMFSRQRRALPQPVVLESFEVESHIGGFTGRTPSIRDWISTVRFRDDDGLSDVMSVRVNDPVEHAGLWYFQSSWDPPDPPRFEGDPGSGGLNYTVLGVANRNGVLVQLAGCCLAVIGMIYAFYLKPVIKRRRQRAVYARVESALPARHQLNGEKPQAVEPASEPQPVAVAKSAERTTP